MSGSGTLPLLAVSSSPRHASQPTFLEAAFEARRALATATTNAAVDDAGARMMSQLHGLAECVGEMAQTGLLNVDVTADTLVTQTRHIEGGWSSQTHVQRMPPRVCLLIKLPPELCNAVMQALVVFSAIEADPRGELVEFRELAAMVAGDWPDLGKTGLGRAFEASMCAAWDDHAPSSPVDQSSRLARAVTERLRGAARGAGGGPEDGTVSALEYARRTLAVLGGLNPGR